MAPPTGEPLGGQVTRPPLTDTGLLESIGHILSVAAGPCAKPSDPATPKTPLPAARVDRLNHAAIADFVGAALRVGVVHRWIDAEGRYQCRCHVPGTIRS